MQLLINAIKKFFKIRNWDEEYLNGAVDHYDLERRQRQLDRRSIVTGPFRTNQNYRNY